jgi:hypothetical protein
MGFGNGNQLAVGPLQSSLEILYVFLNGHDKRSQIRQAVLYELTTNN